MVKRGLLGRIAGRLRVRLLLVNLLVLLVPIAGLEFARIHERQLNEALQRDMTNQAALARALVEEGLERGVPIDALEHERVLTEAARNTRTRIRLLDEHGAVLLDTHQNGPPEGPEPPPPSMLPERARERMIDVRSSLRSRVVWPEVADRSEVKAALAGRPDAIVRVRERDPEVLFFVTTPIRQSGAVVGVVYAVRSTQPVLVELYRIRSGLFRVLAVAVFFTAFITLVLAWSISRPLERLSRAAKRVADGEPNVVIPIGGGGEIEDLGEAFASMKERLDARLRYISDFAADVAHEFKSPLTSIRGAAELLGEGAADDPEARRRFLTNIELDVERLDRLVSRLLELSRIEASSEAMTDVDLEALCERVVRRAGTPDQPIRVDFRSPVSGLSAREADLETALVNLVENAVKFSPAGEAIDVAIECAPSRAVDGAPGEMAVLISVRDRGPGISPPHLPRVFDRFFTTDADRDGTGLGLSIVRAVARAHRGEVTVESRPGEGAVFTLAIPLSQEPVRGADRTRA